MMVEATLQAKLDHAFRNFWFQNNEQLKAFVDRFITDWNITLPAELQEVQEYVNNRYPYWRVPVLIPKPASPPLTPIYPDVPQQTLPERPPGTFWETPMGTWAKDNALWLFLGAIAFWYLLDDKGKKKRSNTLGSTATSLKKRPGNRLYYLWQAHPAYTSLHPEELYLAKKKDVPTLKAAARSGSVTLYALYAENVDEARRKVRAGEGEKIGGGLVFSEFDEFADCDVCGDLEGAECADVQPARDSPVSEALPGSVGARRELLEKCGSDAFLMPGGTQARPDVPGYPVMLDDCCYHCGMMKAAYTRIGQALNREGSILEKSKLKRAREGLIRRAAKFADRADKTNACNWSLAAAKRYKIRLSGDVFPFELGRVEQKELFKAPRGQLVLTEEDIAESDDMIIQCLERQGWKEKRIKDIQEAIAEKMTPSLFTSMTEELTGGEVMFQEAVEKCLKRIRESRSSKRGRMELFSGSRRIRYDRGDLDSAMSAAIRTVGDRPNYVYATYYGYSVADVRPPHGQNYIQVSPGGRVIQYTYDLEKGKYETDDLAQCQVANLAGEGCRDKEGKFVPVPQCTGRMLKAEKKAKPKKRREKKPKRAKKAEMPKKAHPRIINVKPKGGKPRGYAAFLKMIPGAQYKDAKFQWVWGKPITIPGFEDYQFFISKHEGKYYVYEASTGKTASEGRSAMDAAWANARKRLEDAKEYFDEAFQQSKKIADYEGMIPIYEDMIAKIPGTPSAKAKEPARQLSNEDKILKLLEAGEMHIDDIGKEIGAEPYQVSASLVMLEIEGRVRQKAGKMFELKTAATSGVLVGV